MPQGRLTPADFLSTRFPPKGCISDTITFAVGFRRVKSGGQRNSVHPSSSHAGSFAPSQMLLRLKQSSNHAQLGCPGPSCSGSLCPGVTVCHVSRVGEGAFVLPQSLSFLEPAGHVPSP